MNGAELVASTNDVGLVVDRNGVIRGWNAAAEEQFDKSANEVLGTPCWEVLQGKDSYGNEYCGPYCPLMRMALAGESVRRSQLFFCDTDGVAELFSVMTLLLRWGEPSEPAVVHFLHPALWDRRASRRQRRAVKGNHQRGELTPRGLEVLRVLARGRTTSAVAQRLRISEATASNHIQHILHKLRVHSRLEAVLLAQKLRLI